MDTTRIERPRSAAEDSGQRRAALASVRVAYLLSQYPAISHTFFLQEILGLRARGLQIVTASINRPDRPTAELPAAEAQEVRTTMYVKDGKWFSSLAKLASTAIAHPIVVCRGLRAVAAVPDLTLRQRAFWLFYLAEALLVGRWLKHRGFHHLHVHFGGAVASVGMLTAKAWRVPFSLTIHGPEELLNVDSYQLREKIATASFVFCISDFCRSQLYQWTDPTEWEKFQVIRLGVDPLLLTPQSRMTTSGINMPSPRTLELISVGRLVPAKGHRIFLEAVRILRDRGVSLRVSVIGGGPDLPGLQAYLKLHRLEDCVSLVGALSHPHTLAQLRRADIFALASFAEGIPVALMEAMSLGLPCVSTYIAGIPELIRSGIDGLLVPPANAEALADAIESLVSDPAYRKSLGQSARQRVITQYNLPLNQELLAQSLQARIAGNPESRTQEPTR